MADDNKNMRMGMQQTTPLPKVVVEAMAYVPFQQYKTVFSPEQGFENGTIFPELNKPFLGTGWGDMK